jgi:hypothetical protein
MELQFGYKDLKLIANYFLKSCRIYIRKFQLGTNLYTTPRAKQSTVENQFWSKPIRNYIVIYNSVWKYTYKT